MDENQIVFTQGDAATLTLTATDGDGNPVDLSGATFTTYIKGPNGVIASFPNSQHTANPDQVNFRGVFTLALAPADTTSCGQGADKEIVTLITIGGAPVNYRNQNILEVLPPTPRQ